jgi:hypothetical protein
LVTGLSCHHRQRNFFHQLDASVGASGPHDFTVRISAVRPRKTKNICAASLSRPSHPNPTFVTIAKRPCRVGRDAKDVEVIWVEWEWEYFCKVDWTGSISLIRFNKSRSARRAD